MIKSWHIRTKGRIEFLLVFIAAVLLIFLAFSLHTTGTQGGTVEENLSDMLFIYFPFILTVVLACGYWIFKKKIPKQITIDSSQNEIVFQLNKKNAMVMAATEITYSLHHYLSYSVLIFYKKSKDAKPSSWYYKEFLDIVAPAITLSWKKDALNEIANQLETIGVKKDERANKKSFVVRILG